MNSISADSLLIITNQSSCLPLVSRAASEEAGQQLEEPAPALAVFVVEREEDLLSLVARQLVALASGELLHQLRS